MQEFNKDLEKDLKEKEEYLSQLEVELLKRELLNEAKARFSENDLPVRLLDCIKVESLDGLKENVEILLEEFNKAVEVEVNERLLANTPKVYKNHNNDPFLQGFRN